MKRLVLLTVVAFVLSPVWAKPAGAPPPRRPAKPAPKHHHAPAPHHHKKESAWGKGGKNFWPGFVGGLVAGAVARTVAAPTAVVVSPPPPPPPPPVVVTPAPVVVAPAPVVVAPAPVYQTQNVWVEGRYVDTVQPNGVTVRTWQPGHYEQRTIQVR